MSRTYMVTTRKRRLMIAKGLLKAQRRYWVVFDLDSGEEGLPALTGGFLTLREALAAAEEIRADDAKERCIHGYSPHCYPMCYEPGAADA